MKIKKNVVRGIVVGTIIFTILYFTAFKVLKNKIDSNIIYYMYGGKHSDSDLKLKIWFLSAENIKLHGATVAISSICNDNNDILEYVDKKGGEFTLTNLRSAYICDADNSISFLEKKGFSIFDNDLEIPKYLLEQAIRRGTYSDTSKNNFKKILDKHEKLKKNNVLMSMVENMGVNFEKDKILQKELMSFFIKN